MANESAKKRVRENAAKLRWLASVLLFCSARHRSHAFCIRFCLRALALTLTRRCRCAAQTAHLVIRLLLRSSSFWHKAAFGGSALASVTAYGRVAAGACCAPACAHARCC
jgi:hypothetical protein